MPILVLQHAVKIVTIMEFVMFVFEVLINCNKTIVLAIALATGEWIVALIYHLLDALVSQH